MFSMRSCKRSSVSDDMGCDVESSRPDSNAIHDPEGAGSFDLEDPETDSVVGKIKRQPSSVHDTLVSPSTSISSAFFATMSICM